MRSLGWIKTGKLSAMVRFGQMALVHRRFASFSEQAVQAEELLRPMFRRALTSEDISFIHEILPQCVLVENWHLVNFIVGLLQAKDLVCPLAGEAKRFYLAEVVINQPASRDLDRVLGALGISTEDVLAAVVNVNRQIIAWSKGVPQPTTLAAVRTVLRRLKSLDLSQPDFVTRDGEQRRAKVVPVLGEQEVFLAQIPDESRFGDVRHDIKIAAFDNVVAWLLAQPEPPIEMLDRLALVGGDRYFKAAACYIPSDTRQCLETLVDDGVALWKGLSLKEQKIMEQLWGACADDSDALEDDGELALGCLERYAPQTLDFMLDSLLMGSQGVPGYPRWIGPFTEEFPLPVPLTRRFVGYFEEKRSDRNDFVYRLALQKLGRPVPSPVQLERPVDTVATGSSAPRSTDRRSIMDRLRMLVDWIRRRLV